MDEVVRRSFGGYKTIWAEHEAWAETIIRRKDSDAELMIARSLHRRSNPPYPAT